MGIFNDLSPKFVYFPRSFIKIRVFSSIFWQICVFSRTFWQISSNFVWLFKKNRLFRYSLTNFIRDSSTQFVFFQGPWKKYTYFPQSFSKIRVFSMIFCYNYSIFLYHLTKIAFFCYPSTKFACFYDFLPKFAYFTWYFGEIRVIFHDHFIKIWSFPILWQNSRILHDLWRKSRFFRNLLRKIAIFPHDPLAEITTFSTILLQKRHFDAIIWRKSHFFARFFDGNCIFFCYSLLENRAFSVILCLFFCFLFAQFAAVRTHVFTVFHPLPLSNPIKNIIKF